MHWTVTLPNKLLFLFSLEWVKNSAFPLSGSKTLSFPSVGKNPSFLFGGSKTLPSPSVGQKPCHQQILLLLQDVCIISSFCKHIEFLSLVQCNSLYSNHIPATACQSCIVFFLKCDITTSLNSLLYYSITRLNQGYLQVTNLLKLTFLLL